jgi:hypothetical protein
MTRKRRTAHFRVRLKTFLIVAAVGVLLCGNALGTCSIKTGTTKTCGNVTPSWGGPGTYYSWQVSPGIVTNLLTSEMGITPPSPGTTQIPVQIPQTGGTTVHEVHGNVAFMVWPPASCGSGSVIAQVRDQSGNTIAGVYLVGLSSVGSYNFPIKANLSKPLPITSLLLQTYTSQCGAVTISWSLVME